MQFALEPFDVVDYYYRAEQDRNMNKLSPVSQVNQILSGKGHV